MSAIYGMINWFGEHVELYQSKAIQNALKHRATDGDGVFQQNNILIGTHQLIVTDYQKNEELPYQDAEFVITADARIDNRNQLIALLEVKIAPEFISDSFLILHAFKKWGVNCPKYLEGEFAFVIWNKSENTLFAATDHIGFRSFYYYYTAETFVFASEIKGILAVKDTTNYFNQSSIINYLSYNRDGSTFDKDIFSLKAASCLVIDKNNTIPCISKYWELKKMGKYSFHKDEDWAECLRELLIQAVKKRLNTEKNIGIGLSGGLDSSFIAAIAATELQKQNKPLFAFSNLLHDDCKHISDESYYIKLMGKMYTNIVQTDVQSPLTVGPFADIIDSSEKIETISYPFIYADEALFGAAQEKSVGVILSGMGGDFTISHNGQNLVYELIMRGNFMKASQYFFALKKQYQLSILTCIKAFIWDYSSFRNLNSIFKNFNKKKIALPLNKNLLTQIEKKGLFGTNNTSSFRQNIINMINSGTIGGVLFESHKKLSSYYDMEMSSPIFDKNINEFFLDVPPEQFFLNNKRRSLMRRAMSGMVPHDIQTRDDKGPFSPDFLIRFKYQEEQVINILKNVKLYNKKKFVNEPLLLNYLSELQLANDEMTSESSAKARYVTWAIKLLIFIEWLQKKGYVIH